MGTGHGQPGHQVKRGDPNRAVRRVSPSSLPTSSKIDRAFNAAAVPCLPGASLPFGCCCGLVLGCAGEGRNAGIIIPAGLLSPFALLLIPYQPAGFARPLQREKACHASTFRSRGKHNWRSEIILKDAAGSATR